MLQATFEFTVAVGAQTAKQTLVDLYRYHCHPIMTSSHATVSFCCLWFNCQTDALCDEIVYTIEPSGIFSRNN